MSAEQRRLFEETLAADEASPQAQLQQAKGEPTAEDNAKSERTPRRQPLPAHLYRVEHHHEPQDTHCPTPGCGRAMVLVGKDVSEKLDIVPAELFLHRHIYGKWACRCWQRLVQEPRCDELLRNQGAEQPAHAVDAESGLVHTVVGTGANINDVTQAHALLHGKESDVFAEAVYQGLEKRDETQDIEAEWHVAIRPGELRALNKERPTGT